MGSIAESVGNFLEDAIEDISDFVQDVWQETLRVLEEVFSWFGIEDETIVDVKKISTLVYGDNTEDVIKKAIIRAVLQKAKNDGGFFPNYVQQVYAVRAQIRAYYQYAKNGGYIHGLPEMVIKGGNIDNTAIGNALNTERSGTFSILTIDTTFPTADIYYKHELQQGIEAYLPGSNTLTYTDPYGASRTDWNLDTIAFDAGAQMYKIDISRTAVRALFWIRGPDQIIEGEVGVFTIFCNRVIPTGKSVTVNLSYGGTAPATDYIAPPSVVLVAGETEKTFNIVTNDDIAAQGNRNIVVSISSITNTNAAFEEVGVHSLSSIDCNIIDDDAIILTMPSLFVDESAGSVTIPVKLENALTGGFSVDYAFTNGTAVEGLDYTGVPGTLNFVGTTNEVQNIVVPIAPDLADDDYEYFTVFLTNPSDPSVVVTCTSTITIVDGTESSPAPDTAVVTSTFYKPNFAPERSLVLTYYATSGDPADWFYWVYPFSAGTYVGINPEMTILNNLEMLPVAILRSDKINVDSNTESQEYISTKQLLKRLGVKLDEVLTNLSENPDIELIDDGFFNFSMCPSTPNKVISKMLYLSFYQIIVGRELVSNMNEYSATFSEQNVNNAIGWTNHIWSEGLPGVVTTEGDYHHTIGGTVLNLYHQTSAGAYNHIQLFNLKGMAAIAYDGYHNIAVNQLGDEDFTVPVSLFVFNQLTAEEQMEVYQYIFRLDFYSIQVTHLAWYETSAFFDLFSFVLTVVTVVTAGATGGLLAVVQQVAINYLVVELVIFVAEATGNAELAAVVGLVAAIALSPSAAEGTFIETLDARRLLDLTTNFANNASAGYGVLGEGLAKDIEAINEAADKRLQEIEEQSKGLSSNVVTPEFIQLLQSVDTQMYPAIQGQYQFDLTFSYDRLVSDYFDNRLSIGVQ